MLPAALSYVDTNLPRGERLPPTRWDIAAVLRGPKSPTRRKTSTYAVEVAAVLRGPKSPTRRKTSTYAVGHSCGPTRTEVSYEETDFHLRGGSSCGPTWTQISYEENDFHLSGGSSRGPTWTKVSYVEKDDHLRGGISCGPTRTMFSYVEIAPLALPCPTWTLDRCLLRGDKFSYVENCSCVLCGIGRRSYADPTYLEILFYVEGGSWILSGSDSPMRRQGGHLTVLSVAHRCAMLPASVRTRYSI